jgi:hypothetical protein
MQAMAIEWAKSLAPSVAKIASDDMDVLHGALSLHTLSPAHGNQPHTATSLTQHSLTISTLYPSAPCLSLQTLKAHAEEVPTDKA